MIFKKSVIEKLSKELLLPYTGTEQDWDIEMADPDRINDFLLFYHMNDLSLDERVTVMALILASYEDFLNENNLDIDSKWNKIKLILKSEKKDFVELIDYWALDNEQENNIFKITSLIRII